MNYYSLARYIYHWATWWFGIASFSIPTISPCEFHPSLTKSYSTSNRLNPIHSSPKVKIHLRCEDIILGCSRKLGSMVSTWLISPTYKWGIPWGYNPLILTFYQHFQRDIQVTQPPSTNGCSIAMNITSLPPNQSTSLHGGLRGSSHVPFFGGFLNITVLGAKSSAQTLGRIWVPKQYQFWSSTSKGYFSQGNFCRL